jgi:signal transduction histidine kinase
VGRLTVFYSLALLLIGVIVVSFVGIGNLVINPARANDAITISLLLQEQVNSGDISLNAAASIAPQAPETSSHYLQDLATALELFEGSYQTLRIRVATQGPGQDLSQARATLAEIDPYYHALLALGLHLVDLRNDLSLSSPESLAPTQQLLVATLLSEEDVFDSGMIRLTQIYQNDLDLRETQQETLDTLLITLTFAALVMIGVVIFRPATRQVARSVQELARAEERQRELAALKDQFIIDANHELRTPIMALYNNLELLSAAGERVTPERRMQLLQRALMAGDAVLSLLTNVLDTGIMESRTPRLDVKSVALAPLVRVVLETFDPREIGEPLMNDAAFNTRSVTMDIPLDLEVQADEARLRQILINLISNALKYSSAGTPITISASIDEEKPARQRRRRGQTTISAPAQFVAVRVRDLGLGVPPRDVPKLFNRFVRLERDITSTVRGTGVGLYISRILVEAMGGRIWVDSTGMPGEGSAFSFTLPLAVPAARSQTLLPGQFDLAGVVGESGEREGTPSA